MKIHYFILLVFINVLLISEVFSKVNIVNTESLRGFTNQSGFQGHVANEFELSDGNTKEWDTGFELRLEHMDENFIRDGISKRTWLTLTKFSYGESNNQEDEKNGFIHLRNTSYLNTWMALEFFGQTQFNKYKKIKNRQLLGANSRFIAFKEKRKALFLGIGYMAEHEELTGGEREEKDLYHRMNSYFTFKYENTTKSFTFVTAAYFQPRFDDFNDYRAFVDMGLEFSITKSISFVQKVNFTRDNRPPSGIEKNDIQYVHKLKYRF